MGSLQHSSGFWERVLVCWGEKSIGFLEGKGIEDGVVLPYRGILREPFNV